MISAQKRILRKQWSQRRASILPSRYSEATLDATAKITSLTRKNSLVLSYASFGSELNTQNINRELISTNQLVLPRIEGESLKLFLVTNVAHLEINIWNIPEPIPKLCQTIQTDDLGLVLIPGLSFDNNFNRLGYGRGYYDRLLPFLSKHCIRIGIGFKEQYSSPILPFENHDVPLSTVHLF